MVLGNCSSVINWFLIVDWFSIFYSDVFISFSNQLFVYLEKHVNEKNLFLVKDVLMDRLYYSVLPFRVWNNLFMYERLNSFPNMCGYCSKLCIKNNKISDHINNNLFVHINGFPNQLKQGIIMTQKVPLFVWTKHTNIVMSNDRLNFGSLWYESIDSPFMLWKSYLDILCWIVLNVSHRFIFPLLMSGIDMSCRDFTVCTSTNCSSLKKSKIKAMFLRELVDFCKILSEFCCNNVDPYFIIDVFKRYKRGEDYFSTYLGINRKWIIFADTSGCPCHKDLILT